MFKKLRDLFGFGRKNKSPLKAYRAFGLQLEYLEQREVPAAIAVWNFNDSNLTVDREIAVGMPTMTTTNTGATYFGGDALGADSGDTAGQAFAAVGSGSNGSNATWKVDTTGFQSLIVTYATRGTSTGYSNVQFQYTTDGTTWVNSGSAYNQTGTTFNLKTYNLSTVTALANNPNAGFRIVFDGASGASGNNRIDNFVVSGTAAAAGPTVTSLSPPTGPTAGGTTVTITGTGFTGATAVRFGTTAATSFTVNSATQITAVAPAGTGTVDVTVTTAAGTSATAGTGNDFVYAAAGGSVDITQNTGDLRINSNTPTPQSVVYTLNFTGTAANVDAADFGNAVTTGAVAGTITTAMVDADTYTVTFTPTAGSTGDFKLRVLSTSNITVGGNALTGLPIDDNETITVENTKPTIVSATSATTGTTGAAITYTVTFSEDIDAATFTAADITPAAGSAAFSVGAITKTSAAGAPAVFTVVITPSAAGNLTPRFGDALAVLDLASNSLQAAANGTTATITAAPLIANGTLSATETIQVAGPRNTDAFLNVEGDGNAANFRSFGLADFTFTATPTATGLSVLTLKVNESFASFARAGTVSLWIATGSGTTVPETSLNYVSGTGPTQIDTDLLYAGADGVGGTTPLATATYTPSSSGVNTGDLTFTVPASALTDSTVLNTILSALQTGGKIRLLLTADGATAFAGAGIAGDAPTLSVNYTSTTAPVVQSIVETTPTGNPAIKSSQTVTYTVTFNKPVTGVEVGDFVDAAAPNNGTFALSGSGAVYTVTYTPTAGVEGNVQLRLQDQGTPITAVSDGAPLDATTVTDDVTIRVDDTGPTITSITNGGLAGGSTSTPVTYTVNFSEDIAASSFTSADVTGAGTATFSVGTITKTSAAGAPAVFTVVITPLTSGTLTPRFGDALAIQDLAGNNLQAAANGPTMTISGGRVIFAEGFEAQYSDPGRIYRLEGVGADGTFGTGTFNYFGRFQRTMNSGTDDFPDGEGAWAIHQQNSGSGADQLFFDDVNLRDSNGNWAAINTIRLSFMAGANSAQNNGSNSTDFTPDTRLRIFASLDGGQKEYVGGLLSLNGGWYFDINGDGAISGAAETAATNRAIETALRTFEINFANLPAETLADLNPLGLAGAGNISLEFDWDTSASFQNNVIDFVQLFADADTSAVAPIFTNPNPAGIDPDIQAISTIGGQITVYTTGNTTPTLALIGTTIPGATFTPNADGTGTLTILPNTIPGNYTLQLRATNPTGITNATLAVRVGGAGGAAEVTVTSNEAVLSASETLAVTAVVAPTGVGDPTGSVQFYLHGVAVGAPVNLVADTNLQLLSNNPQFPTFNPSVGAAGSGYTVGNILTVVGGTPGANQSTQIRVDSVNGTGGILTFTVIRTGSYPDSAAGLPTGIDPVSAGGTVSVSGGTGSGATFSVQYGDINRSTATLPIAYQRALLGDLPGVVDGTPTLSPGYQTFAAVYTPTDNSIWTTTTTLGTDAFNQRVEGNPYTDGNLLIERSLVGLGAFQNSNGVATAIDERTTAGALVARTMLPSANADASDRATGDTVYGFVMNPQQAADGQLSLSGDGNYVAAIGYDTTREIGVLGATDPRTETLDVQMLARMNLATGTIDTFIVESNAPPVSNNARGVYTPDGKVFFYADESSVYRIDTTAAFNEEGIASVGDAGFPLATLVSSGTNLNGIHAFGSAGNERIFAAVNGAGTIVDLGAQTALVTAPAGTIDTVINAGAAGSTFIQDFYFADLSDTVGYKDTGLDTLYLTTSETFTNGRLYKFSWNGSAWVQTGNPIQFENNVASPSGKPGAYWVAGEEINPGANTGTRLFITWGDGGAAAATSLLNSQVYSVTDLTGYNVDPAWSLANVNIITTVATSDADGNYAYRGIARVPVASQVDLSVDKTVSDADATVPGNTNVTYTVTVTNNSTDTTATNVSVRDLLPYQFGAPTGISTGGNGTATVTGTVTSTKVVTGTAEVRTATASGIDSGTGQVGPNSSGIRTFDLDGNGPGTTFGTSTLFQNIEGSGTTVPTFAVQDYTFTADPSVVSVDNIRLSLFEAEAAFSAAGKFDIYVAGPGGLDPNLRLAESNPANGTPAYVAGQNGLAAIPSVFDTANAILLGTAEYTGTGTANGNADDLLDFVLADGAESVLLNILRNGGTFRLLLTPNADTPNVAATFAGLGNTNGAPPTLKFDVTSQTINWTGITLAPGQSATLTYTVNAGATPGAYTNTVSLVSLDQVDTNAANNSDAVTLTVTGVVDTTPPTVTFTDDASGGPVSVGTTVTYTVQFSEAVTGVNAGDFVNTGTATVGTITVTPVDADTYTVSVVTTGAGTLILGIPTGSGIADGASNPLATPVGDDTAIAVNAAVTSFAVSGTSVMDGGAGFLVTFNAAYDISALNLYTGDAGGTLGARDVQIVGPGGANFGVDASDEIRFNAVPVSPTQLALVVSGPNRTAAAGLLAAGGYTVTLQGGTGSPAFRRLADGAFLDGNASGTAAADDDYTGPALTVAPIAPGTAVVSIGDVVAGPGQTAAVPLVLTGDVSDVTSVDLVVPNTGTYVVTGFTVNGAIPGIAASFNPATGVLTMSSATPFSGTDDPLLLGTFSFQVPGLGNPGAAPGIGQKSLVDVTVTSVGNTALGAKPFVGADGLHAVAYLGDVAAATGTYNGIDVSNVQSLVTGTVSAYALYQNLDPRLVADVNKDGAVNGIDVSQLQTRIIGGASSIPALPGGSAGAPVSGPDPRLFVPDTIAVAPGQTSVYVPVRVENTSTGPISVAVGDIALAYDTTRFAFTGAFTGTGPEANESIGEQANGFSLAANEVRPGVVAATGATAAANAVTLARGETRTVYFFRFDVKPAAPLGGADFNILRGIDGLNDDYTLLSDGVVSLELVPHPTNGIDPDDGVVTVTQPSARVYAPANVPGTAGGTVTVPVLVDVGGTPQSLSSADVAIRFDPTKLSVAGVTAGAVTSGPGWSFATGSAGAPGLLLITGSTAFANATTVNSTGVLYNVTFNLLPGAAAGDLVAVNITDSVPETGATNFTILGNNVGQEVPLAPAQTDGPDANVDGSVLVNVILNQPPFVQAPLSSLDAGTNPVRVLSGVASDLPAFAVTDPNSNDTNIEVTLTVPVGSLALGSTAGLTSAAGSGTGTVVLVGAPAALTAALDGLTFTAPVGFAGNVLLQVVADDRSTNFSAPLRDTKFVNITAVGLRISEVVIEDTSGTNEYIEVFSTVPNYTIPAGVYLVGLEGDATENRGSVTDTFDLGGFVTGTNGYLALAQAGTSYGTQASPGTGVVGAGTYLVNAATGAGNSRLGFGNGASTGQGAGSSTTGINTSRYTLSEAAGAAFKSNVHRADQVNVTTATTIANRATSGTGLATDIENASISFVLVGNAGATAPAIGTDYDTTDTGTLTLPTGFAVLDAVGATDGGAGDAAYGAINFLTNGAGATPAGATNVTVGTAPTYVGRVGASLGSAAADWVGGTLTGAAPAVTLATASNPDLVGAALNHVAGPNRWLPTVDAVLVNSTDADPQRSQIFSVQVTFSGLVAFTGGVDGDGNLLDAGANFALVRSAATGGGAVALAGTVDTSSGFTVVNLFFAGGTNGVSPNDFDLADGTYQLTVNGAAITLNGRGIDAAGTGVPGSTRVDTFQRLFGDVNGDGAVSEEDASPFLDAFGATSADANYNFAFDFNSDAVIDQADADAFYARLFGG